MSRLPSSVRQLIAALRGLLIFTVICGIAYPLVMFAISQVAFNKQANGSLVSYHGRVVGSSLLCQEFTDAKGNPLPQYFQPRPSASATSATNGTGGCDPLASEGSNLGPNNPVLVTNIKQRIRQIEKFDHVPASAIPPDAVTVSASGQGRHGQGNQPGDGRRSRAEVHVRPTARLPWRAGRQRPATQHRAGQAAPRTVM